MMMEKILLLFQNQCINRNTILGITIIIKSYLLVHTMLYNDFFFHLISHQVYKLYSIVVSIRNAHDNADSYLCFYNVCIIVCALQCQKSNGHVYKKRFHFKISFFGLN